MKKVFVFLANGFEEIEALTPVDFLRRAGVNVTTVSITNEKNVTGSHKIEIIADKVYSEIDISDADLIILPGGMPGSKNLDCSEFVKNAVVSMLDSKKYVAAICAAPMVFGHLGVLEGKNATCYPEYEEELLGANYLTDNVVVDGNIITSRGMGTAIDFSLKLVEILVDKNMSDKLSKGVIYK